MAYRCVLNMAEECDGCGNCREDCEREEEYENDRETWRD